jgi:flagellar basal-body rod protein FlgB
MNLSSFPLFQAMAGKLSWLSQRQEVLAHNVANVDTPGYEPRDVKAASFRELIGRGATALGLATTSAGHLGGSGAGTGFRVEQSATAFATQPSGNAVQLEEELVKVQDNAMQYQLVTNLYRKHLNLIRLALGRGGA